MSRYFSYIQRAVTFVANYSGDLPLEHTLKNYYKQNRVMGSTDRKIFKQLLYHYYRIVGNSNYPDTESVMHYAALCIPSIANDSPLIKNIGQIVDLYTIRKTLGLEDADYFPLQHEISPMIDHDLFLRSMFEQPKTFIRIKNGESTAIHSIFTEASIVYEVMAENTWAISGNPPLTELEAYTAGKFEIQDYASQQTGNFFLPEKKSVWWDCCAGAGGKSLLLLEKEPDIQLHASDIRQSILLNYSERMWRNKYKKIQTHVIDLSYPNAVLDDLPVCDGIIADVPCTGSGTWSRSPAVLQYFDKSLLKYYTELQRNIVKNVLSQLRSGGRLYYITCSVYAAENENNADIIAADNNLILHTMQYVSYPQLNADSMFIAVFEKR